ncbi:hypothetical protein BLNAU_10909 [Blattamonas nauphoetae]|uniref:Uncharacterized protein n=1 Tax=Blattamonas nauphoetae TaxID=2049346 RepID=A0ABQ9XRD9_9EUKA|nr:hypothetical protein BLNAU_10909 [Blattamonas nauphoetae]
MAAEKYKFANRFLDIVEPIMPDLTANNLNLVSERVDHDNNISDAEKSYIKEWLRTQSHVINAQLDGSVTRKSVQFFLKFVEQLDKKPVTRRQEPANIFGRQQVSTGASSSFEERRKTIGGLAVPGGTWMPGMNRPGGMRLEPATEVEFDPLEARADIPEPTQERRLPTMPKRNAGRRTSQASDRPSNPFERRASNTNETEPEKVVQDDPIESEPPPHNDYTPPPSMRSASRTPSPARDVPPLQLETKPAPIEKVVSPPPTVQPKQTQPTISSQSPYRPQVNPQPKPQPKLQQTSTLNKPSLNTSSSMPRPSQNPPKSAAKIPAKDHPDYQPFFEKMRAGKRPMFLAPDMRQKGLNPDALNNPDLLV